MYVRTLKKNTISVIRQKTGKETLLGWFENQVIVKKDIFEFEVKVTDAAALLKVCQSKGKVQKKGEKTNKC